MEELLRQLISCERDSRNRKELIRLVMREHRTNQQSVMRLVIGLITAMAEQESDPRNEASVRFAKSVMAEVPAENFVLPYI